MWLEHPLTSLKTHQGWLMWSTIYSVWLVRCSSLDSRIPNASSAVLRRWYSVLGQWNSVKQIALPTKVIRTMCTAIA